MAYYKLEDLARETLETRQKIRSKNLDDKHFCLVPFTTIILEPDGQVGMCRHKGSDFPIGHIQQNTISEIWNSPKARSWRKSFLEGGTGFCTQEIAHQRCNHCSENNKLLDDIELAEVQTSPILKLTANLNGKCNLQCQMCDIWKKPNGLYNDENFWIPARREIFPFIKEVDMLSGEPFIQADTYRLIDEVKALNPDCQWNFTTNAHWKLTSGVKEKLDQIKIKNIIISVDSFDPETYHKIRFPGKLETVLSTIDELIAYNKSRVERGLGAIRMSVNFLAQKDNYREIDTAIDFIESKEISPFVTFTYNPLECSLLDFPESKRMDIVMELLSMTPYKILRAMRVINPLIDSLKGINKAQALVVLQSKLPQNLMEVK